MSPSTLGLATLLVGLVTVSVALWVGTRRAARDARAVASSVYRARSAYFVALVVAMAAALALSLGALPYAASDRRGDIVVSATARMWAWEFAQAGQPPSSALILPVGRTVQFDVTALDVNHGFGIYDSAGRLLAQTQAMPGYVNRLFYAFERPGIYHVLCMEFCGVVHHAMVARFEVR